MTKSIAVSLLTAATLACGVVAAAPVHAVSLVPTTEGEIPTTNLGCLPGNPCLSALPYTVQSLAFDPRLGLSRLFVDTRGTSNQYQGGIFFGAQDAGTNGTLQEYWLRPVAYNANGTVAERGQLEVGRFQFNFAQAWSSMTLKFLDVEDTMRSGILSYTNSEGTVFNISSLLASGPNNGVQTLVLSDVKSFIVQLGNPGRNYGRNSLFPTGDGVNMQIHVSAPSSQSVPEPSTLLGLGLVAGASAWGVRRRKQPAA